MPTEILKQIKVTGNSDDSPSVTLYVNAIGNVFIHEADGIEMTDFWMEIKYDEWLEIVKFIEQRKKETDV